MFWEDQYKLSQQVKRRDEEARWAKSLWDKYAVKYTELTKSDDWGDTDDGCYHYCDGAGKAYILDYMMFDDEWFTETDYAKACDTSESAESEEGDVISSLTTPARPACDADA